MAGVDMLILEKLTFRAWINRNVEVNYTMKGGLIYQEQS